MKEINGNLITLAKQGHFDVIVHGCNCFGVMGAGIALAIKRAFPEAFVADRATITGDRNKLGTCSVASIGKLEIVNAYTQYRYGLTPNISTHLDYDAVKGCFKWIKEQYSGKRIGLPLIGSGLGGGSWPKIKQIIEEELKGENVTIVNFN